MKKADEERRCLHIDLSHGTGHEQYGKRPAVLISDTKTNIAIVVPITSNMEALKFPHTLIITPDKQNKLDQKSIAMIFQLRAVDKTRITKIIGRLNKNIVDTLDKMIRKMLDL